ncbi:MAG: ComEA family DNA-binding protein [Polyangiaceae bacterium]
MFAALINTWCRASTWIVAWRFTKPLARMAAAVSGLLFLAFVGWHAVPGALAGSTPSAVLSPSVASEPAQPPSPPTPPASAATAATAAPSSPVTDSVTSHARASPTDPVVLNTAGVDDLRRLPGIGQKRADAIAALRSRLGRFRAIEDLLKVKGIGRAMLKRLRPLVRIDPAPADADH